MPLGDPENIPNTVAWKATSFSKILINQEEAEIFSSYNHELSLIVDGHIVLKGNCNLPISHPILPHDGSASFYTQDHDLRVFTAGKWFRIQLIPVEEFKEQNRFEKIAEDE